MSRTKIEWVQSKCGDKGRTWNPVTGCSHAGSPGCDNCFAKRMAQRLAGRYGYPADEPFRVTFHPERLEEPEHWRDSTRCFICSMSDLFHPDVKFDWQLQTWLMVERNPKHQFLMLTKRPENMKGFFDFLFRKPVEISGLSQVKNLWLGVSAENQLAFMKRYSVLAEIAAHVRFVSLEPLLGPINMGGATPDWVIVGGETGPGARPMDIEWARSVVSQCKSAGVPVFVKALPVNGKISKDMNEWPEDLRIREMPE